MYTPGKPVPHLREPKETIPIKYFGFLLILSLSRSIATKGPPESPLHESSPEKENSIFRKCEIHNVFTKHVIKVKH